MISFEEYKKMMNRNLMLMSRTANGIVDVTSNPNKANYIKVNKDNASSVAINNVNRTLEYLYSIRDKKFSTIQEIDALLIKISSMINEGIVDKDNLFRMENAKEEYSYADVDDLEYIYNWFCDELLDRFNDSKDYIETACFCEYIINPVAHFYTDGCLKISLVTGAYGLMRGDMPLPKYTSRDEYFKAMNGKANATLDQIIDREKYDNFLNYYRSLFE